MKEQIWISCLICFVLLSCRQPPSPANPDAAFSLIDLNSPASSNSSLARLYADDQDLWMSWVEQRDTVAILFHSRWEEDQWGQPDTIAKGADWFNNWADFPQIAVNKDYRVGTYLQRSADGKFTYDIRLNHLGKQGWTRDVKVNQDTTKSEHGFVSVIPAGEDSFFLSWLDGRNTAGGHHDHEGGGGAMTLRGAYLGPNGTLIADTELDARVCDCCNTAAAMTQLGPIVAYRDRTEEEIRDIAVVRQVDGNWTSGKIVNPDNWEIAGCPVNGPAIDAIGMDVALAWFTATTGQGEVRLSFSTDAGENFEPFIRLDESGATGRVDLELLDTETAAVIWMQPEQQQEVIKLKVINRQGNVLTEQIIAQTSAERASGFPQLAVYKGALFFAWTEQTESLSMIKMVKTSINFNP